VFPNSWDTDPAARDRTDASTATLRRAIAFIDEHAARDISIADVAAAANVTIRAVQIAFRRHYGTTPAGYLRRVRLERARQDLLAADPARESVTAVAYRWGFASPGQFTAAYQQAYGVTPDQTLRQGLAAHQASTFRQARSRDVHGMILGDAAGGHAGSPLRSNGGRWATYALETVGIRPMPGAVQHRSVAGNPPGRADCHERAVAPSRQRSRS
ncbi:MAG TPA: helix-turn-helix transcriptional regulator, partial [Pseudonocardiaceae bacterium]|nr:helix-turn-helix transcriptional regulator [Pseudonocardiaceae bacterium]